MRARNHSVGRKAGLCFWLVLALAASACFWEDDGDTVPGAFPTDVPTEAVASPSAANTMAPTALPTPAPPSAGLSAARLLYREGRFGEARDAFEALAAKSGSALERAEAFLGAGNAAFDLNDEDAGFEALEQAVAAAPAGSDSALRARYLLMKRLNDAGRYSEAATLFDSARQLASNSPIAPYYRYEGGRSQWAFDGRAIWAALLAESGTSGALKTAIREESVSRWRAVGHVEELKAALDALILDAGDSEARYERAQIALDEGALGTAAEQLRAIVAGNPSSRFAALALDRLAANGMSVNPGEAGLSYYRRGAYTQAKAVLTEGLQTALTANEVAFRAYYLAASYEDTGDGANAIRYYDMAAASGATTAFVHRAKYWAARTSEWSQGAQAASQRYVQLAQGPPGEFTEEAAFRAGYVLYEKGATAGALATWEALSASATARLEYWRGRALAASGDAAGARAAYTRAVAFGPLDLHGLEASRELGGAPTIEVAYRDRGLTTKKIDWPAISSWLSLRIGGSPPGSAPTAACELVDAGLRPAAVAEIWAADAVGGTWRSFELMREASECGLADVAARLAVSLRMKAGVASHEPPKDLLRVSYPIDYAGTLEVEAHKAGIDPLFFASLIRQESFWDPAAWSPADARGLTQVIPPTGQAIAAELGVVEFQVSDLFRPALSLEFGAYYLGGQLRRYGHPLIALSAYNAGPGNAARWGAADAREPADLVEVIDFVETKNYVTRIYEAYAHYQLAWGD